MAKVDLTHQPLPAALLTLTALVAASLWHAAHGGTTGTPPAAAAPLGELAARLTAQAPTATLLLSGILILWSGIRLGHATARYGLHVSRNFLSMPLYGVAACGILLSGDYLTQSLVLLLCTTAVRNFYRSFHRRYCFGRLFTASLCVGLLPLFYAPGAVLVLLLPIVLPLFRRTTREAIVALAGAALPLLLAGYVAWAAGDGFGAPLHALCDALTTPSAYRFFGSNTLVSLLLWGTMLFGLLCSTALFLLELLSYRTKARGILALNLYLLLLIVGMTFVPSSSEVTLTLTAVPAAALGPILFSRFPGVLTSLFYAAIVALTLAANLFV